MKTLQILGTGCPRCKKLAENTEAAAKNLGIPYRMEKVTEITKIMARTLTGMNPFVLAGSDPPFPLWRPAPARWTTG